MTGLLEVVIEAVRGFLLHEFIFRSRDFVWMAPVGYAIWFAVLGVVILAVRLVVRRWVTIGSVVATFGFLGALSNLLSSPGVAALASTLLALGIGVRLGVVAGRDPARAVRVARRTTMSGAAAVVLLGLSSRFLPESGSR